MAWSTESRQSRGYGAQWEKIRKQVVKRDGGMCQECKRGGRVIAGREVDHIVNKAKAKKMGWTDDQIDALTNLQLLCKPCHLAKTAADEGRTYRPKVQTGLDGWPVE
jgi:5-methylcytosine-specific restriction protein A